MGFARGALALFILAGFSVAAAASEPPVRRFADKSTMSLYEMASRAVVSAFRACPVEMAGGHTRAGGTGGQASPPAVSNL